MTGILPPPTALGDRFRNLRELGAGSFGAVYRADDTRLGRPVALKLMHETATPEVLERMKREAAALARLRHRNVVQVYDAGVLEGRPYLVMELLDGTPLERLRPNREWVPLMLDVASGLEAIHAQGLVHRDLKPSNIMLDRENRAVILDLGLVLVEGRTRLTQQGMALGTLAFMAPELLRGATADRASDWYGWGATFYFLMERAPPRNQEQQLAILAKRPPAPIVLRGVDPGGGPGRAVLAALADDPAVRPTSREAVERLLTPAADLFAPTVEGPVPAPASPTAPRPAPSPGSRSGGAPPAPTTPVPPPAPRPGGRPRVALALGLVAGLAGLAAAYRGTGSPDPTPGPAPGEGAAGRGGFPPELLGELRAELTASSYRGWDAPARWIERPAMRAWLAWVGAGGSAASLEAATLAALRELDAGVRARGLPGPLGPFLEAGPLAARAIAARDEVVDHARALQAELDRGPVPIEGADGAPTEVWASKTLGLAELRSIVRTVLADSNKRDGVVRWLAPGAEAMRRMLHAGIRAVEAGGDEAEALALELSVCIDRQSSFLASGWLATDPPTWLGVVPRSEAACFMAGDAAARATNVVLTCGRPSEPWSRQAREWLERASRAEPGDPDPARARAAQAAVRLQRSFGNEYPPAEARARFDRLVPMVLAGAPDDAGVELLRGALGAWGAARLEPHRAALVGRIGEWVRRHRVAEPGRAGWDALATAIAALERTPAGP